MATKMATATRTMAAQAAALIREEKKAAREAERAEKRNARRAAELAQLVAEKRVVFIDYYQGEHLTITAKVDMPEWGVMAGETVHLVASDTHAGYYYIQAWDAGRSGWVCRCRSVRPCKHEIRVRTLLVDQYREHKAYAEAERIADAVVHVDDESTKQEDAWAAMSKDEQRAAYRELYPDDFSYYAA